MRHTRFVMATVWMVGLLIVAVLSALLLIAHNQSRSEQRRPAALKAQFDAYQQPTWTLAAWGLSQQVVSQFPNDPAEDDALPQHPFIIPVPEGGDAWIRELRTPVTEEERARWIPFEFDGITYYLVPL